MSYLDDPRVLFAAERTLLAWQRTAIALMGFGFVIERFGLFMRMVTGVQAPASHGSMLLVFGVLLLTLGALIAIVSAVQFTRFARALSEAEIPPRYVIWFGPLLNYLLAAIALLLAGWFVTGAN